MGRGIKLANETYVCPYFPIGSLYLSVTSINPSTYFGGTWQQITDDAYLKIVSSNAGQLDGTSSEHKIPLSSMPQHKHSQGFRWGSGNGAGANAVYGSNGLGDGSQYDNLMNRGGGEPYYPYYLGVYVYVRTA